MQSNILFQESNIWNVKAYFKKSAWKGIAWHGLICKSNQFSTRKKIGKFQKGLDLMSDKICRKIWKFQYVLQDYVNEDSQREILNF